MIGICVGPIAREGSKEQFGLAFVCVIRGKYNIYLYCFGEIGYI